MRKESDKSIHKNAGVEDDFGLPIERKQTSILPESHMDHAMTFREDLFSLLFVSLVKPQYKMYCDLVHRTNQIVPYDYKENASPDKKLRKKRKSKKTDEEEEKQLPYCQKFKSFIFCLRPKADEAVRTKTLMLDVIRLPS